MIETEEGDAEEEDEEGEAQPQVAAVISWDSL